MPYEEYTELDFLEDEYFQQWVRTPDESTEHFWQNWLRNHPEKSLTVKKAKFLLESLEYGEGHKLSSKQYTSALENIIKYNRKFGVQLKSGAEIKLRKIWWAAAASMLLIALVIGITRIMIKDVPPKQGSITYIVKEVPAGVKTTIQLPDGTTVKLNSGSTIKYPEIFDANSRQVRLTGEAFFEVVKDVHRPFIVTSGNLTTEVLGTSFNVKAYGNESICKVAVVTGLVRVSKTNGNTIVVEPSSMAVLDKDKDIMDKRHYDIRSELGWKDGILVFKNTPFSDVFKQLENWYGIDIEIEHGMSFLGGYTGSYQNETLKNVLDGISYTYEFKYKITDDEVIIYKP